MTDHNHKKEPYRFARFTSKGWQAASGSEWVTRNPAHPDDEVGRYQFADMDELNSAVKDAADAQLVWRQLPQPQRVEAVLRFIAAVEERRQPIAEAIVLEQGKPLNEALGEVTKACAEARAMAAFGMAELGTVMPNARAGFHNTIRYRPRGLVAAITPWNFPILTPLRKLVPALVYGNAVILKPSEFTPAAACLMVECAEGRLPEGLVQLVIGQGELGAALVGHPGIHAITFTGSVETGRRIYVAAAQHLAKVSLELGGKNAAIVHHPVDVDAALDAIVGAAMACSGQRCTSISRVLVQRDLAPAVTQGLVERLGRLVPGDGFSNGVNFGPIIHGQHLEKIETMVRQAISEGANVACGGHILPMPGYFFAPTLLTGVTNEMAITQEEVFGPVITLQAYDDFDEALEIGNAVDFGLTAALFTRDNTCAQRFLDECEAGMLHINHGTFPDSHMPFGGIKHSGVGEYSVGPTAFRFYTTEHSTYNNYK